MNSFISLLLLAALSQSVDAGESRTKRVLFIGIDGCRTDAFKAADTPNMDRLVNEGAIAENTSVLGSRITGADTVSGPGWSALLTGVWADKHGVKNNAFKRSNFKEYPHFFKRLKQARPKAVTISVASWPLIQRMVSAADISMLLWEKDYAAGDARVAAEAALLLKEKDPDAMVVYFGNVDVVGHKAGFHPSVKEYIKAVEQVDHHVGTMLAALRSRPHYAQEDWLVLVSSDHGGHGTTHEGGGQFEDVRTVFLIASGSSVVRGQIEGPTHIVDVPVTALTHLGVKLDPAWKLDGNAVGLRATD